MSNIPTKEIDGDIAIGRNATMGGSATVRGSATIGHTLRVEGWLDAPNLKTPCKGLFIKEDYLVDAFPKPQPGWWAIVGKTVPAEIYVVSDNGSWEPTGQTGGTAQVSLDNVTETAEELRAALATAQSAVTTARSAASVAEDALGLADEARDKVEEISEAHNNFAGLAGKPGGLATLGADGKLAVLQRPEVNVACGLEVVNIGAYITTTPVCEDSSWIGNPSAANAIVVYDEGTERFMIGVCKHPVQDARWKTPLMNDVPQDESESVGDGEVATTSNLWYFSSSGFLTLNDDMFDFYSYWPGADDVGVAQETTPCAPVEGRLYLATNGTFVAHGGTLVFLSSTYQRSWMLRRLQELAE